MLSFIFTEYNRDKARLYIDQCQSLYQLDTQHKKEMFMLGRQQVKHRQEQEIVNLDKVKIIYLIPNIDPIIY